MTWGSFLHWLPPAATNSQPALRQMCCTWVAPNPLCLDAEIMFQPKIFLDSWVHAWRRGGISENGFQTLSNQSFEYFRHTVWNTGRLLHFPHRGSDVTPFLSALAPPPPSSPGKVRKWALWSLRRRGDIIYPLSLRVNTVPWGLNENVCNTLQSNYQKRIKRPFHPV